MTGPGIAALSLTLLVACGRIGFDPIAALDDAGPGQDAGSCQPASGLVGHWSLDALEGAGMQLLDRSGNGYHGTLIGTPAPVLATGSKSNALDFGATSTAYVELPPMPVNETMGEFNTVALWFYHAGPDVDEALFYMPPGPGAGPPRYDIWLNTDRISEPTLCINTGQGDCWGYSGPELLDQWVHVVAVMVNGRTDASTLYLNGEKVEASCRFGTCDNERQAQNPVTVGANDDTYAWHGLIDDVWLFDRAVDADGVAAIFACAQ